MNSVVAVASLASSTAIASPTNVPTVADAPSASDDIELFATAPNPEDPVIPLAERVIELEKTIAQANAAWQPLEKQYFAWLRENEPANILDADEPTQAAFRRKMRRYTKKIGLTAGRAAEEEAVDAIRKAIDELECTRPSTVAGIIAKAKACRALGSIWDTPVASLVVDIGVFAGEVSPEDAATARANLEI